MRDVLRSIAIKLISNSISIDEPDSYYSAQSSRPKSSCSSYSSWTYIACEELQDLLQPIGGTVEHGISHGTRWPECAHVMHACSAFIGDTIEAVHRSFLIRLSLSYAIQQGIRVCGELHWYHAQSTRTHPSS